ncbi:endonuclease/exonuclease/phosphatase family protein [Cellulomonas endophytica]|uniref:endonuclease/exonuclease/phosphatase family protein n=1 Tax=Cellulomonas endophytica TaxID=2494735 RepID=UPI00101015B7|nr:endonuclease/exonuclease/phosphatase family protein [Cellulomonas endophytica]
MSDLTTLRLMTYNVRGLRDDARAVAAVVAAQSPDVLAVQEPPRGPLGRRRLARLARRTGLVPVVSGRGARTTALLVAPGLPVADARAVRLPWRPGRTRRGASLAEVAGLRVLVVHLGLDARERARHLELLLARPELAAPGTTGTGPTAPGTTAPRTVAAGAEAGAGGAAGGRRVPLVVLGDLNELPSGPSWRRLGERLVDAAVAAGGGIPTFPAARPRKRIDAVLVEPPVEPARAEPAAPADPAGTGGDAPAPVPARGPRFLRVARARRPRDTPAVPAGGGVAGTGGASGGTGEGGGAVDTPAAAGAAAPTGVRVVGSWVPGGPLVARASDHRPVVVDLLVAAPREGAPAGRRGGAA